jgi:hypothetical protein
MCYVGGLGDNYVLRGYMCACIHTSVYGLAMPMCEVDVCMHACTYILTHAYIYIHTNTHAYIHREMA